MASNSPSVSTIILSESLTIFMPKNPFCPPTGNCLICLLFSLPAPLTLTLTISVQLLLQVKFWLLFRLNSSNICCFCSSSLSILQVGKQMLGICNLFPSVSQNYSLPTPRLQAPIVSSVNPRERRYSTIPLYSSFCMFDRQKQNSASDIFPSFFCPCQQELPKSSRLSSISCVNPSTFSLNCSQEPLEEQRKQWQYPNYLWILRAKRLVGWLLCGLVQKGQHFTLTTLIASLYSI